MIPPEVRNFLAQYIDSAELLDVLMLLQRDPSQVWTAESVSNRVFTVPAAAERRLKELEARGLARERTDVPGAYTLAADPNVAAALRALGTAYGESRAAVINEVFQLNADPVKSFSNAFKLRGDS